MISVDLLKRNLNAYDMITIGNGMGRGEVTQAMVLLCWKVIVPVCWMGCLREAEADRAAASSSGYDPDTALEGNELSVRLQCEGSAEGPSAVCHGICEAV